MYNIDKNELKSIIGGGGDETKIQTYYSWWILVDNSDDGELISCKGRRFNAFKKTDPSSGQNFVPNESLVNYIKSNLRGAAKKDAANGFPYDPATLDAICNLGVEFSVNPPAEL